MKKGIYFHYFIIVNMNEHTKTIKITEKLKQNWALFCVGILFIAGFLMRLFVVLKNEIEPIDALQYMEIAKSIMEK